MPSGAIHIGFAVIQSITVDTPSLYFDTPGDVGFGGFGKLNAGHWVRGTHGLFAAGAGADDVTNPMTQAQRNAVYKGLIDDSRGGATSGTTALRGFMRPFNWRQLEQGATKAIAQANRDFSQIAGDLLYLASQNQRLCIMIENRQYDSSGIVGSPGPDYINSHNDTTNGQSVNAVYHQVTGATGFNLRIYQPFIWQALNELVSALATTPVTGDTGGPGGTARTFDQHPNFEGIMFQETAIGIPASELNADQSYYLNAQFGGISPGSGEPVLADMWGAIAGQSSVVNGNPTIPTRDGLLVNACNSWLNSRIFWVMNFLQGQEGRKTMVAARLNKYGIVMGGPDCSPDSTSFDKALTAEYIVMNEHRLDPLPPMIQMSPGGAAGSYVATHTGHVPWDSYYTGTSFVNGSGWKIEDLFLFAQRNPDDVTFAAYNAKQGLAAKYIFWYTSGANWKKNGAGDPPGTDSATGVMQKYPTFN